MANLKTEQVVLRSAFPSDKSRLRKRSDARQILPLFRQHEFNSYEELKQLSCVPAARLSAALTFLRRKGLLESSDGGQLKIDSRSVPPRINASYGHVIAVDIGGSNLRIALADMKGFVLGKWTASTNRTSSPAAVIQEIRKGVDQLLQPCGVPHKTLLAAAVGAPGATNRDAGLVVATSYLGGWKNVPLGSLLEAELRIPVVVENDVKLGAIGENWMGAARGVRDFVFLAIGTGIAAGIFVDGQLVHGPEWVAGEVGYMIVPGTPDAPAKHGTPGSLESMIGGEGVRQQWLSEGGQPRAKGAQELSATGIFYHALAGDARAKRVLDQSARILAYAVYNISTVLNSSLFVLGGGVGMNGPLLGATQRILEPYTQPSRPKLITSALGEDAQLIGAVRLALDTAESRIDQMLCEN